MAYFPLARSSDNRRSAQASVPISLKNVMFEPTPAGSAKRAPYFLKSRPGRVLRATLAEDCRGLFCEPGCRDGNLFAPAGSSLNEISSSWGYTPVGTLSGGDVVGMSALRFNLVIRAFGQLKYYDGVTTTAITGQPNVPAFVSDMAVSGLRIFAASELGDDVNWSTANAPLVWDAAGILLAIYRPDPIVGLMEVGGDIWGGGSSSMAPFNVLGGVAEGDALSPISGVNIRTGLFARDAKARIRDGWIIVGQDRALYKTSGLGLAPIPDRDLEVALRAITEADLQTMCAWSYEDGSRRFFGLSYGTERARVLDVDLGTFSDWTSYAMDVFDIDFAANAFDTNVVAGKNSPSVWELTATVHDDAGQPILREATLHVPCPGDIPIDRLVFDLETYDVPASGDDATPLLLVNVSTDNGETWSEDEEVELPTPATRFKPQMWGLGLADGQAGLLVKMRWTGAFGLAFWGLWVNPPANEITI